MSKFKKLAYHAYITLLLFSQLSIASEMTVTAKKMIKKEKLIEMIEETTKNSSHQDIFNTFFEILTNYGTLEAGGAGNRLCHVQVLNTYQMLYCPQFGFDQIYLTLVIGLRNNVLTRQHINAQRFKENMKDINIILTSKQAKALFHNAKVILTDRANSYLGFEAKDLQFDEKTMTKIPSFGNATDRALENLIRASYEEDFLIKAMIVRGKSPDEKYQVGFGELENLSEVAVYFRIYKGKIYVIPPSIDEKKILIGVMFYLWGYFNPTKSLDANPLQLMAEQSRPDRHPEFPSQNQDESIPPNELSVLHFRFEDGTSQRFAKEDPPSREEFLAAKRNFDSSVKDGYQNYFLDQDLKWGDQFPGLHFTYQGRTYRYEERGDISLFCQVGFYEIAEKFLNKAFYLNHKFRLKKQKLIHYHDQFALINMRDSTPLMTLKSVIKEFEKIDDPTERIDFIKKQSDKLLQETPFGTTSGEKLAWATLHKIILRDFLGLLEEMYSLKGVEIIKDPALMEGCFENNSCFGPTIFFELKEISSFIRKFSPEEMIAFITLVPIIYMTSSTNSIKDSFRRILEEIADKKIHPTPSRRVMQFSGKISFFDYLEKKRREWLQNIEAHQIVLEYISALHSQVDLSSFSSRIISQQLLHYLENDER